MTFCTCGGRGVCTDCVLADLERDAAPVLKLHRLVEDALGRPSNVVVFPGWSKRVPAA